MNRTWLTSWPLSIRSLNTLRAGEFAVMLVCVVATQLGFPIAVALHMPPLLGLVPWIAPPAALFWIGRRRQRYMDRKVRLLAGESVCLDCGYLVNDPAVDRKIIDRCPECGSPLASHIQRSRIRLPAAFVFPELESASSDAQATEWILAAARSLGWVGRHPLAASAAAMVAVVLAMKIVFDVVTISYDPPEEIRLPIIMLILACGFAAFALVQRSWYRRMSATIASFHVPLA